jgi:protein involved in polysaccharide export with SLBB domain
MSKSLLPAFKVGILFICVVMISSCMDQDGYIRFPFLGEIRAAGMTKKSLSANITAQLFEQELLIDPIVDIRYLNYKVSVLGEVGKPSILTNNNEKSNGEKLSTTLPRSHKQFIE